MSDTSIIPTNQPNTIQAIKSPAVPEMDTIDRISKMAQLAAMSGFVNSTRSDKDGRMADAFFVMMQGIEIGIPPMTALRTIHVIKGKPSVSGQALLSLMRRAGVEVIIPDPSTITDKATVKLRRPGEQTWHEASFTQQEANVAKLTDNPVWKSFPKDMMTWRAVSRANRLFTSDITGGLYTIEEFQTNEILNADGDIVGSLPSGKTQSLTTMPPALPQLSASTETAQDDPEANEPPPEPPQAELSLIEKLRMYITSEFKSKDNLTLDWSKVAELAKAKVANPDDFDSWKAAGFKSFAEAFAFVRGEYTKPATPKQNPFSKPSQPASAEQMTTSAPAAASDWIAGLDEPTFYDTIERGFFGMSKRLVNVALGIEDVTVAFASPSEAMAKVHEAAKKECWRLICPKIKYVGGSRKHLELQTALGNVISFTRDPFRENTYKEYCETWKEGEEYTFTDAQLPVAVIEWKWAGDKNPMMTVTKVHSLDQVIPF